MKARTENNFKPLKKAEKKPRWKRIIIWTSLGFLAVLILARIALPHLILKEINKKLAVSSDYICVVKGISLNLMGQSATLKGIEMTKRNGNIDIPFFVCGDIHVNLESFKEKTTKVVVHGCTVNLVKGKNKEESQLDIDEELKALLAEIPVLPNVLLVKNANIHFIENHCSPTIEIALKDIQIDGRNIENASKSKEKYPSTLTVNGDFEGAKLKAIAKFDKQGKEPLVHLVSSLEPVQISRVKNLLKVYADLDVDAGTLSASSTILIHDGRIDGFVDPVAKNLVFHESFDKKVVKLGTRMKHQILNNVSKLLGKEEEKIETRIEIHGTIGQVQVDVWDIIHKGLKNSFLQGTKKEG